MMKLTPALALRPAGILMMFGAEEQIAPPAAAGLAQVTPF